MVIELKWKKSTHKYGQQKVWREEYDERVAEATENRIKKKKKQTSHSCCTCEIGERVCCVCVVGLLTSNIISYIIFYVKEFQLIFVCAIMCIRFRILHY